MVSVPKVHRVRTESLKAGAAVEQTEHPWASPRTARKIARDHLQKDPNAYAGGKGGTTEVQFVLNQNVRVKPAKPRKKPMPRPQAPSWQTYGSALL